MVLAERVIAAGLMLLSAYFMWYATALPIGWAEGQGPGGGAFPFWLSVVMLLAAAAVFLRTLRPAYAGKSQRFFDGVMLRPVLSVIVAMFLTIALMSVLGAYVALPLFLLWYLRIYGRHGWLLTGIITLATPVFLFFFFEVTLKILLPKGVTEPAFYPLYSIFF